MLRMAIVGFFIALVPAVSAAHEDIPHPVWCEGGIMQQVGAFSFDEFELAPPPAVCGVVINKNCGQFDDDYGRGYETTQDYCHGFSRARRAGEIPDAGSVIVLVTSPESFLSANHHEDYSVAQGIEGVCLRCEGRLQPVLPVVVPRTQ